MNDFLKLEIEKSFSFLRQRTYDGGPRAAEVLAYKLKKQQKRISVMQLNYKNTKAVIRGRNEIGNQIAKFYHELYDAAQNPVHKKNLIN